MPLRLKKRNDSANWWITGTVAGVSIRESAETDRKDLAEIKRAARENELYRAQIHGPAAVKRTFAEVVVSYLDVATKEVVPLGLG